MRGSIRRSVKRRARVRLGSEEMLCVLESWSAVFGIADGRIGMEGVYHVMQDTETDGTLP